MALKDWKRNYQNGNQFIKDNIIITISENISSKEWIIRIYNKVTKNDVIYYRKNRTQALKFARQYMRTH